MTRETTERVNVTLEKDGTFPVMVGKYIYKVGCYVEAAVTMEVTRASFKGSYDEPPDPDTTDVVDACVKITLDDDSSWKISGCLELSGEKGIELLAQYWDFNDLEPKAVETADSDDDADFQYETQREMQEELGGA